MIKSVDTESSIIFVVQPSLSKSSLELGLVHTEAHNALRDMGAHYLTRVSGFASRPVPSTTANESKE